MKNWIIETAEVIEEDTQNYIKKFDCEKPFYNVFCGLKGNSLVIGCWIRKGKKEKLIHIGRTMILNSQDSIWELIPDFKLQNNLFI